jgi:hypothetical protein
VRPHSYGLFAGESHKVDAAWRRWLVGRARCLWVVELWIELAGLKSRFSKQRKRFDTKWVDFLDDEVHGGCSARPNVRANPDRGGRCCKAGRRRWYRWRCPALQRLP